MPLSGIVAKAVTRGYHLISMPGNRIRIALDWATDAVLPQGDRAAGPGGRPAIPLDTASPELPRHP